MKILVINTTIFPVPVVGYAGLEVVAYLQAKGLAAKGHQVSLIAADGSTCPGVDVIAVGEPGKTGEKQSYDKYWPTLFDYDVIIDHTWQKYSYLLKGEKAVTHPGTKFPPILGWMHAPIKTMYNTLPPNVEKPCFVCISKSQANIFEAFHERESRYCYNPVDFDFYKPLPMKRNDRLLFVARFSSIKGPDIAVRAVKRISEYIDTGLDLIGDTQITQEPHLYQLCKEMADGKRIKIHGNKSRGECVWWMSQAKAFLHPNKHFVEPFGLAPVEAQACGLPVIAWDKGAMRETILDGETGILVKNDKQFEDAVEMMAKEPISDGKRKRCREWVAANFSVSDFINRTEELCKEAIECGW